MTRQRFVAAGAAVLFALSMQPVRADVRSDQKARVQFGGMLGRMVNLFGGRGAREGVTSTVAVKGDRKATLNDQTGQIVDLAEEKVYDLDLKKKSYRVTTFAELRRRMEEAQQKAAEDAKKQEGGAPAPAAEPSENQVEVDVDVKNTGQKKTINGFDTQQVVMTITLREKGKTLEEGGGMVLTSDQWMAPKNPALDEIVAFDMKFAQKVYGGMFTGVSAEQMAAAMAFYPMMKQALGRMTTEGAKIDGTPILTTLTMDAVKSQEQMAQEAKSGGSAQPPGSVGGLLGGLARRAARRNDDEAKARATFLTSTTEVLKIDTTVAATDVAIPAGFKESK
jgi:hypothetical protein